jgi:hypothetical protein
VCGEIGYRNGGKSGGVARNEIDILAPIFTIDLYLNLASAPEKISERRS